MLWRWWVHLLCGFSRQVRLETQLLCDCSRFKVALKKKAGRISPACDDKILLNYGTNLSLFILMLSTETPQLCPGRTSAQVPSKS